VSSQSVDLATLRIPAESVSAKIARDLVSAVAKAAGVGDETVYFAKLATSELVTNAARYAESGSPVDIRICRAGDLLHIAVEDSSPVLPEFRDPDWLAENGYGLIVVDDVTDDCGYHPTESGKAVWFSLKATWAVIPRRVAILNIESPQP
jgi:anti-sigma regulatory factor (Ser/Thr protein kinase)